MYKAASAFQTAPCFVVGIDYNFLIDGNYILVGLVAASGIAGLKVISM